MYPINLGVMIGSKDLFDEVQSALYDLPARTVLEQRELGDPVAFIEKLDRVQPDVLLLGLHQLGIPLGELIRQVKAATGSPMVVVVNASAEPEQILAAMRAGADEYVFPPLREDLRAALERMSTERAKLKAGTHPRGKVYAFLSAKGGCGATTIACHLAVELQRQTKLDVLLADFDVESGIIGFLMKSQSRYTLLDAVQNAHRLDLSLWKALVSNGGYPGVEVMMAPTTPGLHDPLDPRSLQHLVPFARASYDWSVLDLGHGLSPVTINVLGEVDETWLVTTLDIPALHQTKQIVQTLLDSGYKQHRLHVLLNRIPKRMEVTLEELDRMLGIPIYATLPNDYSSLYEAYSEGSLLPVNSSLRKHLAKLAGRVAGVPKEEGKKGFLFLF